MPTIASISPQTGAPGTQVAILGSGFAADSIAWFASDAVQAPDPKTVVVSSSQINAVVPDGFGGSAGALLVSVLSQTTGALPSNTLPFSILAAPTEDGVTLLCSLADVKAMLGIDTGSPANDAQIEFFIGLASAQVCGYCKTNFQPVTINGELHDGDGSDLLVLNHTPIVSVQAASIDTTAVDVTTLRIYPQWIKFVRLDGAYNPRLGDWNQFWPEGTQNISVSYTAGYTSVPGDLARVVPLQVAYLINTFNKQGVMTETNNTVNATTAYAAYPLVPIVQQVANRYRNTRISSV